MQMPKLYNARREFSKVVNSEIKIKFVSHNYVYVLEIRKYTRHLLFRLAKIEVEIPFSFFVLRNASAI